MATLNSVIAIACLWFIAVSGWTSEQRGLSSAQKPEQSILAAEVKPKKSKNHIDRSDISPVQPPPLNPSPKPKPKPPRQAYPAHISLPTGDFLVSPPLPAPFSANKPIYEAQEILIGSVDLKAARAIQRRLRAQGYRLIRRTHLKTLDLFLSVFRFPDQLNAVQVAQQLAQSQAGQAVVVNHLYRPQGNASVQSERLLPVWHGFTCPVNVRIGLLDGIVNTGHPALAGKAIKVISLLYTGEVAAGAGHATAIASLLMGDIEHGGQALLPNATLINAAIYRQRAGQVETTAEKILIGLDRLAQVQSRIIMLSLGGPPNALLHLGIQRLSKKGVLMVAAAGNGGEKGPPVYPAAWPEVMAVTAVDRLGHIFEEATHGEYIEVAAPGIQLKAAWPPDRTRRVSGTSYAVPFVAAALSVMLAQGMTPSEARQKLAAGAHDLGESGRDPLFGFGMIQPPKCKKIKQP